MTATTLGLSGSLLARHWARRSLVSQALVGRGSSGDPLVVLLPPNTKKSRKEDHDDDDKARGNHAISSRVVKRNTWTNATATSLLVRSHSLLYHHHNCQNLQTHPQRRAYHATPQQPLVLYGTIIIVVATGYVIYRKAQGKPIAPDSLLDAKKEYHAAGGQYSRAAFERRQAQKMLQQQQQQQQNEKAQEKLSSSESEQIKG